MKQLTYLFLLFPLAIFGQKANDIISFRVGYSSTNIGFKEAFEPSVNIFGRVFNTGKTFVGESPEFGISKALNNKIYVDISYSSFSGRDTKLIVNNNKNYYTLKGFQVPLTVNYLLRNNTKRFRINIGVGVDYLKAHLQQYESVSTTNGQVTNQINDIHISELQFALRPGVEFRIIPNLFVSWIVRVGISTNGRYVDNPILSLRYTFKTKK
jgi:hypothetical protein